MRAVSFITALAGLAMLAGSARAAEQVTLRNGFALRCDHHAPVDGRVRVFLSAGGSNYIEFRPEEIAVVEAVADEPAVEEPAVQSAAPVAIPKAETTLSAADLREMLARAGHEHNLDVDLLASLVKAESGGNSRAVSRAGARGLMQLMPGTAANLGVRDSFEPEQNVGGGAVYLNALLVRYHDNIALALAAYNAGPEAVDRYHGIPPYRETQTYVAWVIHEFNKRVKAREAEARRVPRAPDTQRVAGSAADQKASR